VKGKNMIQIGKWKITNDSGKIKVLGDNASTERMIVNAADLNDLIVALLVSNPGDNPTFANTNTIAQDAGRTYTPVARMFTLGRMPGAIEVFGPDGRIVSRAIPSEAIRLIRWAENATPDQLKAGRKVNVIVHDENG
jgi:hypothetical protein